MNWNFEHIVWISVGTFSILWYLFIIGTFWTDKKKKRGENNNSLHKSSTFVNNDNNSKEDLELLLNQIDKDQADPELLKVFGNSNDGLKDKSLTRKANEKFKIIRNRDEDDFEDQKEDLK